jgi:hypothetical protein
MADDPNRLSDAIAGLHELPRSVQPDPGLEDRVVTALRSNNLLGNRSRTPRHWRTAAAAAALFVIGLAAGYWSGTNAAPAVAVPSGPVFALLLYGEASIEGGATEAQLVEEYGRWAIAIREAGHYITGERLNETTQTIGAPLPEGAPVRGFFLVSAANLEQALALARSCPHVRRGGQIIVRPVDPT